MSDETIEQLILEAALDEVSVNFVAQNAQDQYGIHRDQFDNIVKNAILRQAIDVENEYLYDFRSGIYTKDMHFMSTSRTISELKILKNR